MGPVLGLLFMVWVFERSLYISIHTHMEKAVLGQGSFLLRRPQAFVSQMIHGSKGRSVHSVGFHRNE